jgi:hypothetical protein
MAIRLNEKLLPHNRYFPVYQVSVRPLWMIGFP